MRRKKFFCASWSRFAQASTAALIMLVLAGAARADTVDEFFIQDGTAGNVSGMMLGSCAPGAICPFFGTLKIDVTTGAIEAVDLTFPGLSALNILEGQIPVFGDWRFSARNTANEGTNLDFSTTPTPGSLVGFESGRISPSSIVYNISDGKILYDGLSGDVTAVPETSSLALLGSGLIGLAGLARRKLKL